MEWIIGLVAVAGGLAIPMVVILTRHQRQVLEMKLKLRGSVDNAVSTEIDALRQEIQSLRNTTMQYDLSFDAALQRLENRVEGVERRIPAGRSEEVGAVRLGM